MRRQARQLRDASPSQPASLAMHQSLPASGRVARLAGLAMRRKPAGSGRGARLACLAMRRQACRLRDASAKLAGLAMHRWAGLLRDATKQTARKYPSGKPPPPNLGQQRYYQRSVKRLMLQDASRSPSFRTCLEVQAV
ncbi:hypothetical protein R1sor_005660 [Riccia sorocarpa]|uniref:Uncharacterized protein n=1 Tax=Riccia sorocarpa TaxID=122646 RepID=A0ABD3H9X8_9MARC